MAVMSIAQFVWMVRWRMLHFSELQILCTENDSCRKLLTVATELPRILSCKVLT